MLAGGEAIHTGKTAFRQGVELDWNETRRCAVRRSRHRRAVGVPARARPRRGIPVQTYPLFENALRGRAGRGAAEHRLALGRLFAPFTRVAAENPYAFYGVERSAEQLAAVTAENRLISDTYPKWMNAMDGDQPGRGADSRVRRPRARRWASTRRNGCSFTAAPRRTRNCGQRPRGLRVVSGNPRERAQGVRHGRHRRRRRRLYRPLQLFSVRRRSGVRCVGACLRPTRAG